MTTRSQQGISRFLALAMLAAGLCTKAPRTQAQGTAAQVPASASTDKAPAFDVISIKPNKSGSGGTDIDSDGGNYSAVNVSLRSLLINAYDLKEGQLVGLPSWADSARFDIQAKVVNPDKAAMEKMSRAQRRAMMEPILTERFGLKSHAEMKVLPVYELVVAKGGPKFKASAAGDNRNDMTTRNQEMTATSIRMDALATELSGRLHRIVLDKTGLDGRYDFTLKWTRDDAPPSDAVNAPPVLLTALQEQLGLKLVATKASVPTFVIDHVELPSEN